MDLHYVGLDHKFGIDTTQTKVGQKIFKNKTLTQQELHLKHIPRRFLRKRKISVDPVLFYLYMQTLMSSYRYIIVERRGSTSLAIVTPS